MSNKKTLKLHFIYVSSILTIIIIELLTFKYAPDTQLFNYVSFAATICSLILAIIAIIQGIYSSSAISSTVINMHKSSEELVKSSLSLQTMITDLDGKIAQIPETIHGVQKDIAGLREFFGNPSTGERNLPNISKELYSRFIYNGGAIGVITLYWVYKCYHNKQKFSEATLKEIFEEKFAISLYSYFMACKAFSFFIVDIDETTNVRWITIKEVSTYVQEIPLEVEKKVNEKAKLTISFRDKIDSYFDAVV